MSLKARLFSREVLPFSSINGLGKSEVVKVIAVPKKLVNIVVK